MISCTYCGLKNHNAIYQQRLSCDICVEVKVEQYKDLLQGKTKDLYESIICYEQYDATERKRNNLDQFDDNRKKRIAKLITEIDQIGIEKATINYKKGLTDEQANA